MYDLQQITYFYSVSFHYRCHYGYYGDSCTPSGALRFGITTDFTHLPDLERDWQAVYGGQVVAANEGCGMLLSGESLYFSGVRNSTLDKLYK